MVASDKTIGRLSLYRRILHQQKQEGKEAIYSHELAALANCTPAQVRRDIMTLGYTGSPVRGYDVDALMTSIGQFLDAEAFHGVALVGVGNLGRALLSYFVGRNPRLSIVAAFDVSESVANRVINGCPVYAIDELESVIRDQGIGVAIVAVPATEAQAAAQRLYAAGIRGILNFAPVRLWAPDHVYVEDVDLTMSLERVIYFARNDVVQGGT
ncbi:MAG: hypothetical protein AMXMBFR84_16380 [Candidatus Hydrogenedentota bacterium]